MVNKFRYFNLKSYIEHQITRYHLSSHTLPSIPNTNVPFQTKKKKIVTKITIFIEIYQQISSSTSNKHQSLIKGEMKNIPDRKSHYKTNIKSIKSPHFKHDLTMFAVLRCHQITR